MISASAGGELATGGLKDFGAGEDELLASGFCCLLLKFARTVRADLDDMRPRDMIDIQSFLWVQGSDEYPD
jgi:hypothetical protein